MSISSRILQITVVAIISCSGVSGSDTNAMLVADRSLISKLLTWIDVHTDYDVSQSRRHHPQITFFARGDSITYEGNTITIPKRLRGLYDKQQYKIILVKPWQASVHYDVSTLLHELVHVVQYQNKNWLCWQRTEWEAYQLQEQYLKEHGIDPQFNWLEIAMFSSCRRRDIHPAVDPRLQTRSTID